MIRTRWFKCDFPYRIRDLADAIRDNHYSSLTSDGFVLDVSRDEFLEARYFERYEFDEIVIDPLGEEIAQHRVAVREARFRVSDQILGLEILNGHNVQRTLLNRLSAIADFRLAVHPLSVDPLQWSEELGRRLEKAFEIRAIQFRVPEVGPNAAAKVLLEGSGAKAALVSFPEDGRVVERVSIRGLTRSTLYLHSTAQATVDDYSYPNTIEHIRVSLKSAIARSKA